MTLPCRFWVIRRVSARLSIDLPTKTDPAAVFNTMRIVMRPVHEPTEFVPLVHTAKMDSIPKAQRHALRQVDVVRNQQALAITQLQDKTLVS